MIRKQLLRTGSVLLSTIIFFATLTGCGSTKKENAYEVNEAITAVLEDEVKFEDFSQNPVKNGNIEKRETVYVFTDSAGAQQKLIINEKLMNGLGSDSIEDQTLLSNIINLSGDETKTENENNLVWNAGGKDILYQGEIDKQVPIEMKITYYLDGEEISAKDIAGKSGHITIHFDYLNHEKRTITVCGEEKEVCVPFTVLTALVLPKDKFSNVSITNGKMTEVMDKNTALGIVMPGLSENLDMQLGDETLEMNIPDYFEVSADVNKFELETIMTIVTTNVLSDIDLDSMSLEKLKDRAEELNEAANDIEDGTVKLQKGTKSILDGALALKDGMKQLNDKVPGMKDGVERLNQGAISLADGSDKLYNATKTLADGAGSIFDGSNTLESGTGDLYNGAKQLASGLGSLKDGVNSYTKGVDQAASGVSALDNQMDTFAGGMQNLYKALSEGDNAFDKSIAMLANGADQLKDGNKQLADNLQRAMETAKTQYAQCYSGCYQLAVSLIANSNETDAESAKAILAQNGLVETPNISDQGQMAAATGFLLNNANTIITYNMSDQQTLITLTSGLSQTFQAYALSSSTYQQLNEAGYFAGMENLAGGLNKLQNSVGSFNDNKEGTICYSIAMLNQGAGKLKTEGTSVLNDGMKQLVQNSEALRNATGQLKDGSDALEKGASDLKQGAGALKAGASQLASGAGELNAGCGQLNDGLKNLKNGTSELKDGVNTLQEGTTKLYDGTIELSSGADELNVGAITLKDGMIQFNEEGVEKITSLALDDGTKWVDTFKQMITLGKEYQSFAGKTQTMEGSVMFIYKTEGICVK